MTVPSVQVQRVLVDLEWPARSPEPNPTENLS